MTVEINEGVWKRLTGEEPPLPFASWIEGRDVLAAHLGYAEWNVASVAARQALRVVEMSPRNPKPGQPITPNERANLETMVPDLAAGMEILQPLSHGTRVPPLWRAMLPAG
jgi:hypothetical protein